VFVSGWGVVELHLGSWFVSHPVVRLFALQESHIEEQATGVV
jgi:hypothetical protein